MELLRERPNGGGVKATEQTKTTVAAIQNHNFRNASSLRNASDLLSAVVSAVVLLSHRVHVATRSSYRAMCDRCGMPSFRLRINNQHPREKMAQWITAQPTSIDEKDQRNNREWDEYICCHSPTRRNKFISEVSIALQDEVCQAILYLK